ncbi:MAG TPA: hypothetical protein VNE21_00890, partial [Mycobacteriales bacterium]|nr:hypothetical protein [Mycobacteriales bacterium]
VTAGIVGVRNIDWQNRPTFQQVVNFTGHRAGAAAVAGTPEGPAGGSPAGLPLAVLPLAVVAAAAVVPSRSRRRRWGPGVLPA